MQDTAAPLHSQYPTHQLHEVECCQQYPNEAMGVEGDRVLRGGEDDDKGYHYHEGTQDLDGSKERQDIYGRSAGLVASRGHQ